MSVPQVSLFLHRFQIPAVEQVLIFMKLAFSARNISWAGVRGVTFGKVGFSRAPLNDVRPAKPEVVVI